MECVDEIADYYVTKLHKCVHHKDSDAIPMITISAHLHPVHMLQQ